ncbi:uncharacterized protein LOC142509059 [Primulina tabacum]|uniref:uncharacterized protein LOC142509059 n=1 Tax=Primulina tabacum TaxID=48773 RepID=UPI003F5A67DB
MAENRDNHNEFPREVPIREHFRPVINAHYSGIAHRTIAANNFELNPTLISTWDQARIWLQSLPLESITTWANLVTKFLSKYFPPAKFAQLKIEITNFRQRELEMTINSYQWPSERYGSRKPAGVYAIDPIISLIAQVSALTTHIAAMNKAGHSTSDVALVIVEEEPILEEAQYINNNRGYGGYRGKPPPNTYHPGLRNHENFSYANNKIVLNPPPGFNTQTGEGKPSFEDLVGMFVVESGKKMERTESRLDSMETHMGNMGTTMKSLETQIGEQRKAVTLRSGKEIGIPEPAEENVEILVEEDDGKGASIAKEKVEEPKKVLEQQPLPKVNLPYPQRFKKKGLDDQFVKVLEILKKIHINIPFADALEQMPNYPKFMKDLISKKRKLQEFETVKLTKECSAILQRKLTQKLKDPGIFTIPFVICGSIRTLELGEVKPSTITLQLSDRSLTYPRGIIEDVLVKVEKFIFPVDFVI